MCLISFIIIGKFHAFECTSCDYIFENKLVDNGVWNEPKFHLHAKNEKFKKKMVKIICENFHLDDFLSRNVGEGSKVYQPNASNNYLNFNA